MKMETMALLPLIHFTAVSYSVLVDEIYLVLRKTINTNPWFCCVFKYLKL